MGIGRLLINMEAQLEAKAEGGPVPELELVLVQAELEHVLVAAELELLIVPVAELELLIGLVAEELEHVPVEVARLGPAAAELAPGRVEVARRLGPVAVAPRTKLVTAAHHPDLVPLLAAEEDLAAAVAETTREPAAAEAVIAWAAEE